MGRADVSQRRKDSPLWEGKKSWGEFALQLRGRIKSWRLFSVFNQGPWAEASCC